MAQNPVMINDIISEHKARIRNLTKYYPFFVLSEMSFAQYKDGKYAALDMGYITLASMRYFINENSFNEREVSFEEYSRFLRELLKRDFEVDGERKEIDELIIYIFDKLRNEGKAFNYTFYDPEAKEKKLARVRILDSRISEGRVVYSITSEAIEFYLDTKEAKDESRISISSLLLEKMIKADNFAGGVDVVMRINAEVTDISRKKEQVIKLLEQDVFGGAAAYEEYMNTCAKWFDEEAKSFAKNKALVEKAVAKLSSEIPSELPSDVMSKEKEKSGRLSRQILTLSDELKKTIYNHSRLIEETMELKSLSDRLIARAKLKKLRPVFDYGNMLDKLVKVDRPELLSSIVMPFFAPRRDKSFNLSLTENILKPVRGDAEVKEKVEKKNLDHNFKYEDELLDEQTGRNFARMFRELLDQIKKWGSLNLKELNAIYEIKFGKEIYKNRDYYAYLVHLASRDSYDMREIAKKQDTFLDGLVMEYMSEEDKKAYSETAFKIDYKDDDFEIPCGESIFTVRDMVFSAA